MSISYVCEPTLRCHPALMPRGAGGRPLKGRDARGRPVSVARDYVQATLRLPPEVKAVLDAIANLEQRDRSSIVVAALQAYLEALPTRDREAIEKLAGRVQRRRAP